MKLGVVLHHSILYRDKKYFMKEIWYDYINLALKPFFQNLIIAAPVTFYRDNDRNYYFQTAEISSNEYEIMNIKNNKIKFFHTIFVHWKLVRKSDLLWIFMPCWRGVISALLCMLKKTPFVIYLGGDFSSSTNAKGLSAALKNLLQNFAIKHSVFTLAAGKKLTSMCRKIQPATYETYPVIKLSLDHISKRADTCHGEKIYCLYVGSMGTHKCVNVLIEGLAILHQKGYHNVRLILIGPGEKIYLKQIANKLGIDKYITFYDYIPNGPKLYEKYKQAETCRVYC